MAQKFTSLDEAAEQLGVSKDRLNQLREAGKVRAYRDGASWKFRSEDIDKLEAEGLPQLDPGASDLALDMGDDAGHAHEDLEAGPASDISLDEVDEPTVAGIDEGSDDALALDDDSIDINKDSILLSDAELGSVIRRPPSTIIGKAELDLDADLDLSPLDKGATQSDVRLAGDSGTLLGGDDDIALDIPSPSDNFEGLEELEVDLEAESSRILSPEDVAKAQAAAKSGDKKDQKQPPSVSGLSDLGLAPLESDVAVGGSDVNLGSAASGVGLSGLSALELDDDEVLGEGSDVTLSGESSGINIISPSDSGLALDEVALDLSGSSPIGSSLDLGSVAEDLSLEPLGGGAPESKIGEDFQLTPLGEEEGDEEKDSSQVIALDELSEESAVGAPLPSGLGEHGMMGEEFAIGGLTPGASPVAAAAAVDMPFSLWNVLGLSSCMLLLLMCGAMTFDLLRNMWSWSEENTISSYFLEVLNPFLGR